MMEDTGETRAEGRWRHKKRGGTYQVRGNGSAATDAALPDMAIVRLSWFEGPGGLRFEMGGGGDPARGGAVAVTTATLQAEAPPPRGTPMVAYAGPDGATWVRATAEFLDGRFERIPG